MKVIFETRDVICRRPFGECFVLIIDLDVFVKERMKEGKLFVQLEGDVQAVVISDILKWKNVNKLVHFIEHKNISYYIQSILVTLNNR